MDFHEKWRDDQEKLKAGSKVLLEAHKTDPNKNSYLILRRWNNQEYKDHYEALLETYRVENKKKNIPQPEIEELQRRAVAKHVLVGWINITDRGKDVPYTEEIAFQFLKESKAFYNVVVNHSSDHENFLHDLEGEITKNS